MYKEAGFDLGKRIAEKGWVQLNGGGRTGLMGAATEGALAIGGTVDCCIEKRFVANNMHHGFRNVDIREDMTSRKAGLYENATYFVAAPGGLGTLEGT